MTHHGRAFHYPLEPLQRKCEWDYDERVLELADLNSILVAQGRRINALKERLADTIAYQGSRMQALNCLDLDARRQAYHHLSLLGRQLASAEADAKHTGQQREDLLHLISLLGRHADGIRQHRARSALEYASHMAQLDFKHADDMWLQRSHWRKQR